jgi:hypothetical protein
MKENLFNLEELLDLYDNPNGNKILSSKVVLRKNKFYIVVEIEHGLEEDRKTEKITIAEIS